MATYKVVDADQLNADMSSVADSIRTKGGTTDALAWPDGYKTAIEEIQTGGGSWSQISDKPFNTIDGNTLVNRSGTLYVNTTDNAEQDNTRPITSSGVHVICGNINALLQSI